MRTQGVRFAMWPVSCEFAADRLLEAAVMRRCVCMRRACLSTALLKVLGATQPPGRVASLAGAMQGKASSQIAASSRSVEVEAEAHPDPAAASLPYIR
jgi:hypothetical protein